MDDPALLESEQQRRLHSIEQHATAIKESEACRAQQSMPRVAANRAQCLNEVCAACAAGCMDIFAHRCCKLVRAWSAPLCRRGMNCSERTIQQRQRGGRNSKNI